LKDVPLLQIIDAPNFPLEYSRPRKLYSAIIGAFLFGLLIVMYFTFIGFNKSGVSKKIPE
jgi:uncharacterized protein involved in exopolysaccharide biosynthesis